METETPQRNLRRFALWGGNPKKEHFVLQSRTLRFYFSEHFVLRIITGNKTFAYDISVQNSDGVMIYYNYINSGNELEVSNNNSSSKYEGSINIPNEVTYMGQTRDVTRIGNDAFDGCSGLTSITIPNSVTWIGSDAFYL